MFLNSTRPLCLLAVCAVLPLAVGCGGNKSSKKSATTTAPVTSQDDHGNDAASATALAGSKRVSSR